jgi:hypothetical protein
VSIVLATILFASSVFDTSAGMKTISPPFERISFATASPSATLTSQVKIFAPSFAHSSQAPLPKPPAPPVMTATLPSKRPITLTLPVDRNADRQPRAAARVLNAGSCPRPAWPNPAQPVRPEAGLGRFREVERGRTTWLRTMATPPYSSGQTIGAHFFARIMYTRRAI